MPSREFGWGPKHRLLVTDDATAGLTGVLKLDKPGGKQDISIVFPDGVTLGDVEAAWAAQGCKWDQIFLCEQPAYVAIRVIWLTDELCLAWYLLHFGDAPHDACNVIRLPKAAWDHGEITAAVSA